MLSESITYKVRAAIFEVYNTLGPGLLESVYEGALVHELLLAGAKVRSQVALPVVYKGVKLDLGFRIDLMVEDEVLVEIKSVDALHDVHKKQLLTYLKLSRRRVGLLVNFNVPRLQNKVSLIRIVN